MHFKLLRALFVIWCWQGEVCFFVFDILCVVQFDFMLVPLFWIQINTTGIWNPANAVLASLLRVFVLLPHPWVAAEFETFICTCSIGSEYCSVRNSS